MPSYTLDKCVCATNGEEYSILRILGSNWTIMTYDLNLLNIQAIVINDNEIIAGSDSGVMISNTYGENWKL